MPIYLKDSFCADEFANDYFFEWGLGQPSAGIGSLAGALFPVFARARFDAGMTLLIRLSSIPSLPIESVSVSLDDKSRAFHLQIEPLKIEEFFYPRCVELNECFGPGKRGGAPYVLPRQRTTFAELLKQRS